VYNDPRNRVRQQVETTTRQLSVSELHICLVYRAKSTGNRDSHQVHEAVRRNIIFCFPITRLNLSDNRRKRHSCSMKSGDINHGSAVIDSTQRSSVLRAQVINGNIAAADVQPNNRKHVPRTQLGDEKANEHWRRFLVENMPTKNPGFP
jgi:hypothetical protein